MLEEVIAEVAPGTQITTSMPPVRPSPPVLFPGSPTIRLHGRDIDATYTDPERLPGPMPPVPEQHRTARTARSEIWWVGYALIGARTGSQPRGQTPSHGCLAAICAEARARSLASIAA